MAGAFQCSVVTPEEEVFDGEVAYASIPAWDGQVGVAPQRAAMLLKLGDGILRLDAPEGAATRFFVGGGIAQMKDNRLMLLSDEAIAPNAVDLEETRAVLAASESRRATTPEEVEQRSRAMRRARALLQLASDAV